MSNLQTSRTLVVAAALTVMMLAAPAKALSLLTGEDCQRMSDGQFVPYMTGAVDGYSASPFVLGASDELRDKVFGCLRGKTNGQTAAVVRKWFRTNPERWDEPCVLLISVAIRAWCWPEQDKRIRYELQRLKDE